MMNLALHNLDMILLWILAAVMLVVLYRVHRKLGEEKRELAALRSRPPMRQETYVRLRERVGWEVAEPPIEDVATRTMLEDMAMVGIIEDFVEVPRREVLCLVCGVKPGEDHDELTHRYNEEL